MEWSKRQMCNFRRIWWKRRQENGRKHIFEKCPSAWIIVGCLLTENTFHGRGQEEMCNEVSSSLYWWTWSNENILIDELLYKVFYWVGKMGRCCKTICKLCWAWSSILSITAHSLLWRSPQIQGKDTSIMPNASTLGGGKVSPYGSILGLLALLVPLYGSYCRRIPLYIPYIFILPMR